MRGPAPGYAGRVPSGRVSGRTTWQELLRGYQPPPPDPAIAEALAASAARRKREAAAA